MSAASLPQVARSRELPDPSAALFLLVRLRDGGVMLCRGSGCICKLPEALGVLRVGLSGVDRQQLVAVVPEV